MLGEIAHSFCAYRCNFPPPLSVCMLVPQADLPFLLSLISSPIAYYQDSVKKAGISPFLLWRCRTSSRFSYGSVILFFMGLHEDKNTDWQSTLTKKNMRLVVHATQHIWAWHCRGPSNWLSPSTAPSQETKAVFFIAGGYWLAQGKYQAQEWLLHWLSKESFINSKPVT